MHFHRPLKKADFPTAMTFWRLMDLQTDNDTFLFEKCQFPLMTEVMSSLCGDSANKKSLLHSKWRIDNICAMCKEAVTVWLHVTFSIAYIYAFAGRVRFLSASASFLRWTLQSWNSLPGQHIWTPAFHLFCTAHALLLLISHNLTFTSVISDTV